jgi:fatty acid desaturase
MMPPALRRPPARFSLGGDPLYMLTLRFIAHLPYFKVACVLMLPQGLSAGGLLAAALVNALACLVASRWSAGLRRVSAELPHRAVLPLLGTTAVLVTMMVAGPVLTTLLPLHPDMATDPAALIPAWFIIVAPVSLCFFAAQYLTAPRRRAN